MDIKQKLLSGGFVSSEQFRELLDNKKSHYRIYTIKQGKKGRVVCQPDELMDSVQRALLNVYKSLPASSAVAAYERGCSVGLNAARHCYGKHLLHADIKNFFPSISRELFMAAYSKKYDDKDTQLLWEIASLEGGLPVGSCLSPFIANRVMMPIDKKLKRLKFGIKYTRYADDMVFSANKVLDKSLIAKLTEILRSFNLQLNNKKTYFMTARKQVNGILVDDGKLSLGTSYKKQLKQLVYNLLVKKKGNFRRIAGKLAYLNEIEPQYAQVVFNKYRKLDDIGLFLRAGYYKNSVIPAYSPHAKII